MPDATPTIHLPGAGRDVVAIVQELTAPSREREGSGLHVVVRVEEGTSTAFGRVHDPASQGHGSQRWLEYARRGSSPGGWSEQHHPRSEQHVGYWKDATAESIDRVLIDHCKLAWRLDADAPYVVEFEPVALPQLGS